MTSDLTFRLPDGKTAISIRALPSTSGETLPSYEVRQHETLIATWRVDPNVTTRVSPAMVLDERAEVDRVRHLDVSSTVVESAAGQPAVEIWQRTWISVYALWLVLHEHDVIPIALPANHVAIEYVLATGLGALSPFERDDGQDLQRSRVLLLAREPFWQGAGAPDHLAWLRARPEAAFPGFNGRHGAFASQVSFTRKGNVCTTHPLRAPKPPPGTVVYSRYIAELGQQFRLIHIDAANPLHFESYCRWQNSDRVNHGWKERGPDSKHAAYLESQRLDPHTMSLIFFWDDEPAGYSEVGWAKEDNTAPFVASNCNIHIGEFDQNSHVLVGEEKFRGGKRYQAVATSIKHLCFLRDPRTQQVIAEPRFDLPSVPIQARFLPQERKKRVQLPHKQAVLFALQRDRFFQDGHFY